METYFKVIYQYRNDNFYKVRRGRYIPHLLMLTLILVIQHSNFIIAEDVCSLSAITATTKTRALFSPNFPNSYPNNIDCTSTITSPENTVIEIEFFTFLLEKSDGCEKDYIKITDNAGDIVMFPSCGTSYVWPHCPDKMVSRKNDMTIRFKTDGSFNERGFNATIRAVQASPHLLVMATEKTVRMTYRYNNKNFSPTLHENSDPIAVDYDPRTQFVYYSDNGTKTISKFHVERRSIHDVVHFENVTEPLGLRIDVISRLLYWTDVAPGTISVSNLDGEFRYTLIREDLEKPGAIVTEPYKGFIYFTDWGTNPKIERADGDGKNRFILVNSLMVSPRSLTIDLKERTLYWIDSAQKSLEKVKCDGTGRALLKIVDELNVFSLVFYDDVLFWTGYSPSNTSVGYIYYLNRTHLETNRYSVKWNIDKYYKGISLRPYQESGSLLPGTCPTPTTVCSGLCIPKPNGTFACLEDDLTPPAFLNCPNTISVWAPPGNSSSTVSWNELLLEDDHDFIISSSHLSGSEFFLGSEIVSIIASDLAGNKAWCNFSVNVNEHTQTTHVSIPVYVVLCIGGTLILIALVALSLQVVYIVCKLGRRNNRHTDNPDIDCVHQTYSGDLLISKESVHYLKPAREPIKGNYTNHYQNVRD